MPGVRVVPQPLEAKPEGRVLGIGGCQISRRIAQTARDAGLGEGYSDHSPRVGMAVRMTRKGAPMQAVQRQGRWASSALAARCTRNERADEALGYL